MGRQLLVQAERPAARDGAETWQLVVPYGRWEHPEYGTVDNSRERIARYHEHFQRGAKRQGEGPGVLPFTIDHDDGRGLSGMIRDTRIGERGLEALVRWTPQGIAAITEESFPFISPDLVDAYTDPESGEEFEDVLAGASLVARPYFKSMPQVYLEHYCDDPEPTVLWVDPEDPMDLNDQPQVAGATGDVPPPQGTADEAEGTAQSFAEPSASNAAETAAADAEAVDLKQFREMRDELSALQYRERLRQFSDELAVHSFGDRRRLAPGPRQTLAEKLAKLPRVIAGEVMEAVKALRFYEPGESGLDAAAPPAAVKSFSEQDAAVARQLGLSEEDY